MFLESARAPDRLLLEFLGLLISRAWDSEDHTLTNEKNNNNKIKKGKKIKIITVFYNKKKIKIINVFLEF